MLSWEEDFFFKSLFSRSEVWRPGTPADVLLHVLTHACLWVVWRPQSQQLSCSTHKSCKDTQILASIICHTENFITEKNRHRLSTTGPTCAQSGKTLQLNCCARLQFSLNGFRTSCLRVSSLFLLSLLISSWSCDSQLALTKVIRNYC